MRRKVSQPTGRQSTFRRSITRDTSLAVSLSASVVSFSRRLTRVDASQCQTMLQVQNLRTYEPQSVAYLVVLHQKPCVSKDGSQTPTNAACLDTHMVHHQDQRTLVYLRPPTLRALLNSPSLPIGGSRQSRWACKYTASPSPLDSALQTQDKYTITVNNQWRFPYPS
jgi:hypothetical protein